MITTNCYDDNELTAIVLNESRVRTDDRELDELYDEFSPYYLLDETEMS